jgi:DNA-binding transcriptional regulator YiaG
MVENNRASTEERSKRVRYIREEILRLSRAKFSERTGISPNSLQNWEQGRNENTGVPEQSAKRLLEAFKKEGVDCSLEWLLYGLGNPPSSPFSSSAAPLIKMQDEDSIIKEELALFHTLNQNTIDAIINDDAMSPYFWPGDVVAGKYYENDAIKKALGLPCIVQTKTGGVFVRLLEEGESTEVYNLSCSNPQTITKTLIKNVTLVKVAPVLWIRKKSRIF